MERIKLLLAEDTTIGARRAQRLLGDQFEVDPDTLSTPGLVLARLRMDKTEGRLPRVIVTNLMFQDGGYPEAGVNLIRSIRVLCPNIVIVAWSKAKGYLEAARQAGANMVFAKYKDDDTMGEKIAQFLQ